jgi:hypothetical protein
MVLIQCYATRTADGCATLNVTALPVVAGE